MNRSPAPASRRIRAARSGPHRRRRAPAPRIPLWAAGIALAALLAAGCVLLFRAPESPLPEGPASTLPPAASAAPTADPPAGTAPEADPPEAAGTPAPQAALPDVTGDWLSEPDAETYAEVISLHADGSCTMISTMVPVDGGPAGWKDGSWYTAPVGEGTYVRTPEDTLVFTLDTPDGEAVYTYALTWQGDDRFDAAVSFGESSYTLHFTRVTE